MKSFIILEGEQQLKKPTKYGYLRLLCTYEDGNEIEQIMSPEKVKLLMKIDELIKKGYDNQDIQDLLELQRDLCDREERDSNVD